MTPELKIACEVVFQEHKTSVKPITWSKDAFRGRLPFGLSAMAKEILVNKNIICFPNPEKKMITLLNPVSVAAANFEEAGELAQKRVSSFVTNIPDDQPASIADPANSNNHKVKHNNYLFVRITGQPVVVADETKWYMKPLYYYAVWPACAAIAGAIIAWLMGFVYSKLFF